MSINFRTRALRPIRNGIIRLLRCAIVLLPIKAISLILEAVVAALHTRGANWITVHRRPKSGSAGYYRATSTLAATVPRRIAIVVQGPLLELENFTVDSVSYYRRTFPNATIIVSTWNDASRTALERCEALGATIVLSSTPSVAGIMNVNFQTTSAGAGLKKAKELGCEYALKVRSDLRIYAPNTPEFLFDLLQTFPVRNSPKQRMRLLSTTVLTSRFCPYFLSDQILFGHIDDMSTYWNPPLNRSQGSRTSLTEPIKEIDGERVPEIYLCKSYCERIDRPTPPSIRGWWQALADSFLIIDRELLDVYWPKYAPHSERLSIGYETDLVYSNLYFRDWLRLYREFGPDTEIPEHLLDLPGTSKDGFD